MLPDLREIRKIFLRKCTWNSVMLLSRNWLLPGKAHLSLKNQSQFGSKITRKRTRYGTENFLAEQYQLNNVKCSWKTSTKADK